MTRRWIWSAVLLMALPLVGGAASEPWSDSQSSSVTVSRHSSSSESGSADDVDQSAYPRLGRGAIHQRSTLDCRRSVPSSHAEPFLLCVDLPVFGADYSAPDSPSFGQAQRDGTLSSRSTGLPPPAV